MNQYFIVVDDVTEWLPEDYMNKIKRGTAHIYRPSNGTHGVEALAEPPKEEEEVVEEVIIHVEEPTVQPPAVTQTVAAPLNAVKKLAVKEGLFSAFISDLKLQSHGVNGLLTGAVNTEELVDKHLMQPWGDLYIGKAHQKFVEVRIK